MSSARLPWFKMWTEARNDSKLGALNDREFRIWWLLLCYAAEAEPRGEIDMIDPEFVAMELRVGVDELDSAISRMVRLRLVERSDAMVRFPSWDARQWEKPSARPEATRERQRRSRAKRTDGVTPMSHPGHAESRIEEEKMKRRTEGVQGENTGAVDNPLRIGDVLAPVREQLLNARRSL